MGVHHLNLIYYFLNKQRVLYTDYDQVDMDATGFGQGRGPMSMRSMEDTGGIGF